MKTNIQLFLIFTLISVLSIGQTITGTLLEEETNTPIPFAKISLPDLHLNTLSDSLGRFEFSNVPNASVNLAVNAMNYEQRLIKLNPSQFENLTIKLAPIHHVFEEVIITKTEGKLQKETVTAVEYRSKENLFASGSTTLGEAMVNIPGVQQNTIGTGISRPVVRGLSGMRVVTYWDGLRIENQQWGEDHGMATSEVGLEGVEVIKGPATLLYGADAVGGIIQFQDKVFAKENTHVIHAATRLESNSHGTTNEVGYQVNNGKIRFNTFANYINHKDFQLPNGKFVEASRFWVANTKSALNFRANNYLFTARHHYSYSQIGIPGHTHDLEPTLDEFISNRRGFRNTITPAQLISNNFLSLEQKLLLKRSEIFLHLGNTNSNLREYDHGFDIPFTNLNLNNSIYNLRYTYHINDNIDLKVGSQGMYQLNRNSLPAESFLIPDADALDIGAYALADYAINKWRFQLGARYDRRTITSYEPIADSAIISNIDAEPIDRLYETGNFSMGLVHNTKKTTFRLNASTGFRAPHLAELLASGVHHGSLRYEKGDRNLVAEQAFQLDAALELHFEHLEFVINPYVNVINNFIYLAGTDSTVSNQVGNFDYFEFQQLDRALLYGGEVGIHYHPHQLHRLHIESNFSLTIGEDLNGNDLNLMPQPLLNSRIRFDIQNKQKLVVKHLLLEHQNFMTQERVATYERPTQGFHLINFATELYWRDKENIRFTLGVRNLLNTEYIAHLSPLKNLGDGIPQPGINFFGKLSIKLDKKIKKH